MIVCSELMRDPVSSLADTIFAHHNGGQNLASFAPNRDFQHHSRSVWRSLKGDYGRLSARMQREAVGDVSAEVSIVRQATFLGASQRTHVNALVTLTKIGTMICQTEGMMGQGIRQASVCTELVDGMGRVMSRMSLQEREDFCLEIEEDIDKLLELVDLAGKRGIVGSLKGLVEKFGSGVEIAGGVDGQEDAENEEGEVAEEEDDDDDNEQKARG